MKLAKNRPVKIVILGAGGTGGYVVPHLYRIASVCGRPVRIIVADGDVVEDKNLVRQNFASFDVGDNKARLLAERYASAFGIETEFIPDFIESEEELKSLLSVTTENWRYSGGAKPISILIGAVDNNRTRVMCNNVFNKMDDLIYIDSGNGEYTGQVVCGMKQSGRVLNAPVARYYPDILNDTEKFPSELSCAERAVSAPQSIAANLFAATAITTMLYYLLIEGELAAPKMTFSSRRLLMKPITRRAA